MTHSSFLDTAEMAAKSEPTPARPWHRRPPLLIGGLVLAVVAGYAWMHDPAPKLAPVYFRPTMLDQLASGIGAPTANPHAADSEQMVAMTEKLAAKLKGQPQDSEGWAMLARSYGVMERYPQAIAAYEKAIALRGDDNVLRADYAGARKLAGLPPDSRGVPVAMTVSQAPMQAATGPTVSGTVTLAPALMKQAKSEYTLFVFARASEGSRMPLALLRRQVKDLPIVFTLDDSMAMSPASTLSQAGRVVVGARISKSGNAIPEKGDLVGLSEPVVVGVEGLTIEISDVVMQ